MHKIIISLTSYPARIHLVYKVIKSLMNQQEKADEIILWLSILEFPNQTDDLPENLRCMIGENGFHIEWVKENIKSHKKYFYALQNRKNSIITVDDDMYYSETLVSTLMSSYRKHPNAISARNVHIITKESEQLSPYLEWEGYTTEYIDIERMDLCAIGVNGILYPPGCSTKRWFDINLIIKYAENQDDLWLKFNQVIDNIPVVYTGITESDQVLEGSQDHPLYIQNADCGDNDKAIKKMSEELKKEYTTIYHRWFQDLMRMDEMISVKRQYFSQLLESILIQHKKHNIYICGAGKYANILYKFIESCDKGESIKAFLVTQKIQKKNVDSGIQIKLIQDLNEQEFFCVLCGVGWTYRQELINALKPYKFHEWIDIDLQNIETLLLLESKVSHR